MEYWGADCCEWVTSAQASDAIAFETLGGDAAGEDTVEYTPPAMPPAHGKEYFNVLKFYSLSPQVVGSILADLDYSGAAAAAEVRGTATGHGDSRQQEDAGCDRGAEEGPGRERGSGRDARGTGGVVAGPELPFIPDEDEDRLISAVSKAESVLLVGRSGTGKTSIAIGRMFAMYSQWVQALQGGGYMPGMGISRRKCLRELAAEMRCGLMMYWLWRRQMKPCSIINCFSLPAVCCGTRCARVVLVCR